MVSCDLFAKNLQVVSLAIFDWLCTYVETQKDQLIITVMNIPYHYGIIY